MRLSLSLVRKWRGEERKASMLAATVVEAAGFFFSLIVVALVAAPAHAAEVQLAWKPPLVRTNGAKLTNLAGFRVYFGTRENTYSQAIDVGQSTKYTILGLRRNTTYYFAVSAYDARGVEGKRSQPIARTVPPAPGTNPNDVDNDGVPNSLDLDADDDGLSNLEERAYGTNWLAADTDGDGADDLLEIAKLKTNPLDAGDAGTPLRTTICADWNGFLGGMWNVFEHVNRSAVPVTVQTTLFSRKGLGVSAQKVKIQALSQHDSLVHEFQGHQENQTGMVCSRHSGQRGDIDGRMVHYKPNLDPASSGDFQFALSMPMSNGKQGSQYLLLNNNHGSLAPQDGADGVGNWIQITNLGTGMEEGALLFYGPDGTRIGKQLIAIPPGRRADFGAHALGAGAIGLVEWRPDNSQTRFLVSNGRYYYDNPYGADSFDTALQVEGMFGSGEDLYVPLDTINRTGVLELGNTLPRPVTVDVELHGGPSGILTFRHVLPPKGSQHIIVDPVFGPNQLGYARIRGSELNSIVAVAVEYGRRPDGGLTYAYAVPAKTAVGKQLAGSYNTYLGQGSWLVSIAVTPQNMKAALINRQGNAIAEHHFALQDIATVNLNQFVGADQYGTVTLQPEQRDTVVSWVLRVKGDEYVIPAPMR